MAPRREFAGQVSHNGIVSACDDVLEGLIHEARFTHFVPVLTYRFARERLRGEAAVVNA